MLVVLDEEPLKCVLSHQAQEQFNKKSELSNAFNGAMEHRHFQFDLPKL